MQFNGLNTHGKTPFIGEYYVEYRPNGTAIDATVRTNICQFTGPINIKKRGRQNSQLLYDGE